eukprot:GFUD01087455.1.p1 GENE.GFUD01087455.1~~GFUD01087455.1.p1  ORF type:complete len:154 (+),score=42.96 GFUD01087455.1:29-463(+)
MATQIYRSWSTSVKMAWGLPHSTHTWLVANLLSSGFHSVKQQLFGRYVNFVRGLLKSLSTEVRTVASMVARCARSTTGKNIERETGVGPWRGQAWVKVKKAPVPPGVAWRVQYLAKLLQARREMEVQCQDVEEINLLVGSLCRS